MRPAVLAATIPIPVPIWPAPTMPTYLIEELKHLWVGMALEANRFEVNVLVNSILVI